MGSTKRDNRIFATATAANMAIICFLGYWHNGKINIYPLGIGILLLLLALFYPGGIAIFKIPLEKAGRLLGAVLTVVLLLLLYLLIVVKVSAEKMDGTGADEFISKEYPVPSGINDKEPAIIKFKASPGSKTAAVYDIRLLK